LSRLRRHPPLGSTVRQPGKAGIAAFWLKYTLFRHYFEDRHE